jgi:hypothetical protein
MKALLRVFATGVLTLTPLAAEAGGHMAYGSSYRSFGGYHASNFYHPMSYRRSYGGYGMRRSYGGMRAYRTYRSSPYRNSYGSRSYGSYGGRMSYQSYGGFGASSYAHRGYYDAGY